MRAIIPIFAALALSSAPLLGALPTPDPDDGGITLPPGFRALVYADNLVAGQSGGRGTDNLRGLAVAPNGDVYAKEMRGRIFALRDTNGDGRADVIRQFGPGDGGTHIMFHDGYLYHSSPTAVYRYKYIPGELVPSSPLEVIVHDLPRSGGHDQKAFAFDESGHMIVEVGSPFNDYSQGDRQRGAKGYSPEEVAKFQETYGGFWQFDANKTNQTQADAVRFATGIRHCLAVAWQPVSKNFFMCMMGRDQLNTVDPADYDTLDNAERVSEEFHELKRGVNLGWPYTYWDPFKNARMVSPEYGGDNRKRDDNPAYDKPIIAFPAHWAPLQMCLYNGTQFPEHYRNGMFLAFHGSWNRAPLPQAGYRVVFIPFDASGMPTGRYENFAMGFAGGDESSIRNARYRPCGVAVGPDGSLYISETEKGRIWRVIYTGETNMPAGLKEIIAASTEQTYPPIAAGTPGAKVYAQICAACHMPNGSGVSGMQPPLVGSSVIAGDSDQLINVILKGPAKVLPADRLKYQNVMPPFSTVYNDADIASLINYLRANFAPTAPKVTPEEVAAQRAKL
ncbi:MAG TPA: c-type cytochrome [Verrucomicrobiae bacterium]|nr:c-type cytochrome [Verrucomicrobiae bacterium]